VTDAGLPDPLTPADCDISDFDRMSLDIKALRGSKFDAMLDDTAWRAGLNLWMSAWHAVPAGSLDNDDEALAVAAGLRDLKKWEKVKAKALRGFVLCSDGRLYHRTVCELVLEAWLEKLLQRRSSGSGNAKRWGAKFDADQIANDIDISCEHLAKLNPQSKTLAKVRRRTKTETPEGGNGGNPTGTKKPSHRESHRDKTPRGTLSQENGTERIIVEDNPPPPESGSSSSAKGGAAIDYRTLIATIDKRLGDRINTAVSATRHCAALRALIEPPNGQTPCSLDDVLEALDAVAAQCAANGSQLRSFTHPAIAEVARKIRDTRINGVTEAINGARTHNTGNNGFIGTGDKRVGGMVGAGMRLLAQMEPQGASGERELGSDGDTIDAEFEISDPSRH